MNYTTLTVADQKQMLEQRQRQYEQEHFAHSVNKDLLVASGATDQTTKDATKAAADAMATLDKAHAEVAKKIAALPK